jgi:hypothetical protein
MLPPSVRIATNNRSERSVPSPKTCNGWRIGSPPAGSGRSSWESTRVHWTPVFEILEQRGFEVLVVNARDAKHVPGRKTDVSDAQWLQRLHEYGLLRYEADRRHLWSRYGKVQAPGGSGATTGCRLDNKAGRCGRFLVMTRGGAANATNVPSTSV